MSWYAGGTSRVILLSLSLACVACASTSGASRRNSPEYFVSRPAGAALLGPAWQQVEVKQSDTLIASTRTRRDLEYHRVDSDGVLIVSSEPVAVDATGKPPAVLAERWLERVVARSQARDYKDVLPAQRRAANVYMLGGFPRGVIQSDEGRVPNVVQREDFAVGGGSGTALQVELYSRGMAVPDRTLFLAVLKAQQSSRMVVVAYVDSPSMFAGGASEARQFARRVHF